MERLHRILFALSRGSVWLFGSGYLLIAVATTADVVLRNVFGTGVPGVYEISGYVFAVATTWGFSFVLFERAHVRIDVAYQRLGTRLRAWLDLAGLLALLLFASVLAWRGWTTLDDTLLFGARARTTLQTPLWIPQSVWLAGLVFFVLCILFLALYVLLLLIRGEDRKVAQVAGIPHVSRHPEDGAV